MTDAEEPSETGDPDVERTRVEAICREAQPAAARLSGFPEGEPVPVACRTRSELKTLLLEMLDSEYPDDELRRRSRCFAEIGLVPRGYDLEAGMIAAVDQEAGGLYDPHSKVFVAISDLSAELKSPPYQRLIAAHELTHALQDRELDLAARGLESLCDLDAAYALVAMVEGTAMVVGMAHMQQSGLGELVDLAPVLRAGFEAQYAGSGAIAEAPLYLRERLLGPYVDGSAFVQNYLESNPGRPVASIFDRPPASAEQVLHYDKYTENDRPTVIDLGAADELRPEAWRVVYSNTLGEFEIRTLFASHAMSRDRAKPLAEGWDGCRVTAYATEDDRIVVVGVSVWDSVADADEFGSAFAEVLGALHPVDDFEVRSVGDRVGFVIGNPDDRDRRRLLNALVAG